MTDKPIDNIDMPEDDDFDFIERLNYFYMDIAKIIEKRKKLPRVKTEPQYLFYGTREQFKDMSKMEIIMHSSFLGNHEVK